MGNVKLNEKPTAEDFAYAYVEDSTGAVVRVPKEKIYALGKDGGYYIPTVDDDGNLAWSASEEGMPEIDGTNIRGPQGEAGPQGEQGEAGEPGYTPVKGTDYYTDSDKQEMVDLVLEKIPDDKYVKTAEQTLTAERQLQARSNIGAASTAEVSQLSQEKVDKNWGASNVGKIFVVGTDGNITLIDMPEGGASGDVTGVIDENNNILLNGNIPEGTYTLKYLNEDGTYTEVGSLVVGAIVTYTITQNLTNVTSDNSTAEVIEGQSLTVNLTANSGYNMKSIIVTMGGTDITSTAVSGGTISIASVTGNVVITAVATEPNYTNLFDPSTAQINKRVSNSNELKDGVGHVTTEFIDISGKVPFTNNTKIYVKGGNFNATTDGATQARIITFKQKPSSQYTGAYSVLQGNSCPQTDEGNGVISVSGVASSFNSDIKYMVITLKVSDSTITEADIQNIVVTIDEPIV